ncbi:VOC family protein [Pannonibacter phragmitetus]|uniref:VOC family protein n=1 Tax=Pannonibacter phragmitetus TaxID=121719 RepID=UPI000B961CD9|nr:VOC family protein [Pannonibacter phragmitetus]
MIGKFIWYELMTTDPKAAAAFYSDVVGWQVSDSGMPGFDYTLLTVPGQPMPSAGLMALPGELAGSGVPPHWIGYVGVADVDAKAAEFAASGGRIVRPAEDIPQVGRFAVVADPHGAVLSLFKPDMPDGPLPPEPAMGLPGTFGWNELYAGDGVEAFTFYSKMFGWEKDMAVDMGPMGTYQCFALNGRGIGGIMTKMPDMPQPFWNYYINVEALDAAIARVTKVGGKVIHGPQEVPGGAWIINALDPQGAMFSLVSMKR